MRIGFSGSGGRLEHISEQVCRGMGCRGKVVKAFNTVRFNVMADPKRVASWRCFSIAAMMAGRSDTIAGLCQRG